MIVVKWNGFTLSIMYIPATIAMVVSILSLLVLRYKKNARNWFLPLIQAYQAHRCGQAHQWHP